MTFNGLVLAVVQLSAGDVKKPTTLKSALDSVFLIHQSHLPDPNKPFRPFLEQRHHEKVLLRPTSVVSFRTTTGEGARQDSTHIPTLLETEE